MKIKIDTAPLPEGEKRRKWAHDIDTSSLAKRLREESLRNGNVPIDFEVFVSALKREDQLAEGDGLGCAVACYRMMLGALKRAVPIQHDARRMLFREGRIPEGGLTGMAEVSVGAAKSLGIREAMDLLDLKFASGNLTSAELVDITDKTWPALLMLALEKGYIAIGAFPMKSLHEGSQSLINHAVLIYGVRFEGRTFSFKIMDPLSAENTLVSAENLIQFTPIEGTAIIIASNEVSQQRRQIRVINKLTSDQKPRIKIIS